MDILDKQSIQITSLAMDGLAARHKAIASNIANVNTKDYLRVDVAFEGQLKKIMQTEDAKANDVEVKNPLEFSGFKPKIIMSADAGQSGAANNVNIEMEMAELAKNGMKYDALALMQQKAFRELQQLIMGR